MKNVVKKISNSVAMLSVAAIFFGGCSKDDNTSPLVSGGFDGRVTASNVDFGGESTQFVNYVMAADEAGFSGSTFHGTYINDDDVQVKNGGFTMTLPTSGLSSYLEDVTSFFDYFMAAGDKGKIKVSNPNARVMDIDFIGFYYDAEDEVVYVSGIFSYATSDKRTQCMFVYADSDVNITGSANVTVSLKQGWNRVYLSDKLTTKAPDGMKWYFEYFK